jgi:hypothetical protein
VRLTANVWKHLPRSRAIAEAFGETGQFGRDLREERVQNLILIRHQNLARH